MKTLIDRFEAILMEAHTHRDERTEFINDEIGWVTYERAVMLEAVNAERAKLGKKPIANVISAEKEACGHWDYTHKFAIGCAYLVLA